MAGTSSGIVAGLTAVAIGVVGYLAYQAQATVPPSLSGRPGPNAASASATGKTPRDPLRPGALPSGSGTGERVVYSVDDDRVWLVDDHNQVQRSFPVNPGTVDPPVGRYWVTSRSNVVTGTDGLPIEHVVRFTSVDGVVIGFSAALRGEADAGDGVKTGGIRERREDGDAMWKFATIGVPVVVIR
ncbi:hypothetical protein ACFQ9Z_23185 [Streptomyces sp. NPDC056580]|uniref:hypothetical protein n=1 Tax=Streptomyces sp. NPDC056580 TaxID=3345872 RepID=UPI003694C851